MHVGFRVVRNVVVHNERNAVHVNTAGGDVCRDDDIKLAHLEAVDGAFAHGLGEVAVERGYVESAAFEFLGYFGGVLLGAHENEYAVKFFAFENAGERFDFVFVFHEQVALANVFDRGRLAFDAGFFVFAQVLVDNLFDAIRHGRAKEGALGVGGDFLEDGFHVFHKAHVKHFVSFVEDDSLDRSERNRTALDMVYQTARCGNDDACLALEGAQLDSDILTAIDRNNRHVLHLDSVLLDGIRNLDRKFACRREHEHGRFTSVEVDARKERERECGRLACTGLRCSEKICSLQKRRDGLSLNGRGRFVAGELDGFENFRRETEIVKRHQRFVADIFFVCRLFI